MTSQIPGRIEETRKPYRLVHPPKEFFRQFANLAHNRVLNEDFPHEKLLTLKYKGTGTDFVANAKGSLNIKSEITKKEVEKQIEGKTVKVTEIETKDTYPTSSEVKLLTAFHETTTETRFNNKGICKVWTNWGHYNVGEPIEIVSVLKGDNQFKKTKGWVGAYYTRGAVGLGSRLQVRHQNKKGYTFSLAEKLTYSQKDLWAGAYIDLNLNDLKLTQYNAVVGYNVNKNIHFYVEHATHKPKEVTPTEVTVEKTVTVTETTQTTQKADGSTAEKTTTTVDAKVEKQEPFLRKIGFGKGTLTGVYKDERFFALGRVGWEEPTETFSAEAGVVYTVNGNSSVRAKINQDLDLAIGGRHKLNKNFSINAGVSAPLKDMDKFYDSHKTIPIPFGATLEFNF